MASARNWTTDEAQSIIHSYRTERARLLSNSLCSAELDRRLSYLSGDYFSLGRKATQRVMQTLRVNWAPCIAALAAAEA